MASQGETGEAGSEPGRRPKSLILDLYGRYSAQFQGWIAVSDLVDLMGLLGVEEQAVRSAVSRMSRRGLLRAEARGPVRGYAATDEALELFADGDRRIYASTEPAALADGWVLLAFSVPEGERDKRHVLRSRLMWLGMGNLGSGLWIGPRRILDELTGVVRDVFTASYEGLGEVEELVQHSWDLPALARLYTHFIETHRPVRDALRRSKKPVEGQSAFVDYTLALHEWRKFPYLDPGLPPDVLPRRWPGRIASELFADLRHQLEPAAFDYASAVATRSLSVQ